MKARAIGRVGKTEKRGNYTVKANDEEEREIEHMRESLKEREIMEKY